MEEFEAVVVVGVVGEVMMVTISSMVEVLPTVTAVLSLSTSVGKGTEELETAGDVSLCKRREEIERPIRKQDGLYYCISHTSATSKFILVSYSQYLYIL